jgi:hypothetical protein
MSGLSTDPIVILMGAVLVVVAICLAAGMIALGITVWRSLRQGWRDRRTRKLYLGGPR